MKKTLPILLSLALIMNCRSAFCQNLSSSPILSFTNATGFEDNIAQDGEGGSSAISDFNLQIMPINSSGNLLSADPLQYHDGGDWPGYPALITYGDVNPHFGWAVKSDNGNNFSLQSLSFLDWGEFSGATFIIEAFNNNISLGTVSFSGNTDFPYVVLNNTGLLTNIFQNVDEVRVYKQGGAAAWTCLNHIQISSPVSVLPVQGLDFKISQQGKAAKLHWQTTAEEETKNFEVQHSTTGSDWQTIATIAAAGNSDSKRAYSFIDHPKNTGMQLYRLLLRDLDGRKSYSSIVSLNYTNGSNQLNVYPNPTANRQISLKLDEESIIELYNATGAKVMQKQLAPGIHTISLQGLLKGHYHLRSGKKTITIVLQ